MNEVFEFSPYTLGSILNPEPHRVLSIWNNLCSKLLPFLPVFSLQEGGLEYAVWDRAHIRPQLIMVGCVTWSVWPAGSRDRVRSPPLFHSSEEICVVFPPQQTPGEGFGSRKTRNGNLIGSLSPKRRELVTFKASLWRTHHRAATEKPQLPAFTRLSSSFSFICVYIFVPSKTHVFRRFRHFQKWTCVMGSVSTSSVVSVGES